MTSIPSVVPPLPTSNRWARSLSAADPFKWLTLGWRDFRIAPSLSIAYGAIIFLISAGFVGGLVALGWDYILFPAFAGFMVIGPILAVGLYEKSRRIEAQPGVAQAQEGAGGGRVRGARQPAAGP